MAFPEYSVLMSVYAKERPEWLRAAVESMLSQTVQPSEFVIVEDGPLTDGLYEEIARFEAGNPGLFRVAPTRRTEGWATRFARGCPPARSLSSPAWTPMTWLVLSAWRCSSPSWRNRGSI